jgi:hypothetical protein
MSYLRHKKAGEHLHHSFEVFVRCREICRVGAWFKARCTICIGLHKSAFPPESFMKTLWLS